MHAALHFGICSDYKIDERLAADAAQEAALRMADHAQFRTRRA